MPLISFILFALMVLVSNQSTCLAQGERILFIRGADRSGGFFEANNDADRTEHLSDINNFSTANGNHGWGSLRTTLEAEGFILEQLTEVAENSSGPSEGLPLDLEALGLNIYDVIVFGSNNARYESAAVDLVEAYIRNGGSALFISDANFGSDWSDAPSSDQAFLDRFNLIMNQDQGTYVVRRDSGEFNNPDHPIFAGVNAFDGEGVSPIQISTSATVLAGAEGNTRVNVPPFGNDNQGSSRPVTAIDAALMVMEVDAGRVAGHFDRNTFFNANGAGTDITRFDNARYAINLFTWLANTDEDQIYINGFE